MLSCIVDWSSWIGTFGACREKAIKEGSETNMTSKERCGERTYLSLSVLFPYPLLTNQKGVKKNEVWKKVAGKCRRILSNFTGKLFNVQQSDDESTLKKLADFLLLQNDVEHRSIESPRLLLVGIFYVPCMLWIGLLSAVNSLGFMGIPIFCVVTMYSFVLVVRSVWGEPACYKNEVWIKQQRRKAKP